MEGKRGMINIDGHTFDETRLTGGWAIDAGCRGFAFSSLLTDLRCKVYAIDIDAVFDPHSIIYFHNFKQAALTNHSGQTEAYYFGDGTANFVKGINGVPGNLPERPCETKTVPCITLSDIYNEIGTDIDILKLDIEGSEYFVLQDIEPIPKQITVEFHQHCHVFLHDQHIYSVINHLCKFYHMTLYARDEPRYIYNDCLFIRKDLL